MGEFQLCLRICGAASEGQHWGALCSSVGSAKQPLGPTKFGSIAAGIPRLQAGRRCLKWPLLVLVPVPALCSGLTAPLTPQHEDPKGLWDPNAQP